MYVSHVDAGLADIGMGAAVGVTVVIATRDRCAELAHTLTRLAALPERPPVVVVDNGSTDGTPDMVERRFPTVHVVRMRRNHGAVARNAGVALARTRYVAFCDDDSWWQPGALARAARCLDAHPRLALLVARVRLAPGGETDAVSRKMAQGRLGSEPDLPGPSVIGFPACAAVVRRRAFEAAGGFSRLLFFGGEESLLALDLAVAGWGLAYVPDVLARHSPSKHRPVSARRWALQRRNDVLVCWLRLSLLRAATETWRLVRKTPGNAAACRALVGLLLRLPWALLCRRRVPVGLERRLERLGELV